MVHRLGTQVLTLTGLMLILGTMNIAQAATSASNSPWVTQNVLMGGMLPQPCAKGNPYCAANVPVPPPPQAQFDPNQTPCNSASESCGQQYSKQLTQNYQSGVGTIPPPYTPCVSQDNCASVQPWWNSTVVRPIQDKTIPYNPGARTWSQTQNCGTTFIGGIYLPKPCPTPSQ